MRKLFIVLLALMLTASLAFAADGYPSRAGYVKMSTYSPTTCTHVTTSPSLVYKVTIRAKQAAAWCALADSAQTGAYDSTKDHWVVMQTYGNLKAVVAEATQYANEDMSFDPPLYFQNGIYYIEGYGAGLAVSGGDGTETIIYYTGA